MSVEKKSSELYGLMAEFADEASLLAAAEKALAEGFTKTDAFSPVPIHGLAAAVGFPKTHVAAFTLIGGLTGGAFGFGLASWVSAVAYPINFGGRPLMSIPAFIPPTFECTILFAGLATAFGMLFLNGFPHPYHPVFNVERFKLASSEGFFLVIESADPKFQLEGTTSFLKGLNARGVYEVKP